MSNTAPSRADPVVVFPFGRWCPPQETSQPHPPHNFWQRYSQFHIWPWKFKVKVMAKVKPDGHIWGLEINRYVCFSFRGNHTIFGWDIANSIFDLENSRSRSENQPKSNQVIYRSGPRIVPKIKEIQKVVQKLLCEQKSAAGAGGVRTGTKTLSHPRYTGVTWWSFGSCFISLIILPWNITNF